MEVSEVAAERPAPAARGDEKTRSEQRFGQAGTRFSEIC